MLKRTNMAATVTVALLVYAVPGWSQDDSVSTQSGEDMLTDADRRIEEMETYLSEVENLRAAAEVDDDLARIRCINAKHSAIEGFLRLSTDSRTSLAEQVSHNDAAGMQHQYTLITISSQRVSNLRNEASQCAGEILTFAGDTEQQTTIDPDIPDSTDLTADTGGVDDSPSAEPDEPLPEATPFQ